MIILLYAMVYRVLCKFAGRAGKTGLRSDRRAVMESVFADFMQEERVH